MLRHVAFIVTALAATPSPLAQVVDPAHDRMEVALVEVVNNAIKPLGASLDRGNVATNPIYPIEGSPQLIVSALIEVAHLDCKGVEAIARTLKAASEFFAAPHGVTGIKTLYLQTRQVDGPLPLFDAREVDMADLLKLRKRKARPAAYLGAGATSIGAAGTAVPACIEKLCAPEPAAHCTARDESLK